jgi:hypothetical protein
MENAPDEPGRHLVALRRKLVTHFSFKVSEETHIKALEDVTGVQMESDYFDWVISQQL